ncbi:MAG: glycine oxidase ThiO [Polyangiaceae bacterium]|nr:glycine oxidase ThiO [Polyangiaceae bacterium]
MSGRKKPAQKKRKEVLIIGGGIMGTSIALELARHGLAVTVLEKSVPGAEASSAAAGILGPEVEAETEGPFVDLCRRSRQLYPSWAKSLYKETSIDVGFRTRGVLQVENDANTHRALLKRRKFQLAQGRAERLTKKGLVELEPGLSKSLPGGVYFPQGAHITPDLLFRATHIAAERAGVAFKSGAYVKRIQVSQDGDQRKAEAVVLDDGSQLKADHVIVAAGSWTPLIEGLPLAKSAVVPARGQLVALRTPSPCIQRVLFALDCYLIPRDDGRLLIGSTLEFVGYKKGVTAESIQHLLEVAIRAVPALAQAELDGAWSNFRPWTKDHLPLLGRTDIDGLILASGHYRNGILLAPITAETVRKLVLGQRLGFDLTPFLPTRNRELGAKSQKSA